MRSWPYGPMEERAAIPIALALQRNSRAGPIAGDMHNMAATAF